MAVIVTRLAISVTPLGIQASTVSEYRSRECEQQNGRREPPAGPKREKRDVDHSSRHRLWWGFLSDRSR